MKISFHEKKLSYENKEDNQNIKNNKKKVNFLRISKRDFRR